ncbi:hypothetical protein KFF05_05270 [bacterium SCSIO 12827]|nr:hypothetical protein KFF05_05270 [bacterium SCSIO 12827]
MAKLPNRVTETEVGIGILQVAAASPDGIATFYRLKREIPKYLKLSPGDKVQSTTRPNEEMWEQQIRNIKSHSDSEGNIICEGYAKHLKRRGYQITDSGRRLLKRRGL